MASSPPQACTHSPAVAIAAVSLEESTTVAPNAHYKLCYVSPLKHPDRAATLNIRSKFVIFVQHGKHFFTRAGIQKIQSAS